MSFKRKIGLTLYGLLGLTAILAGVWGARHLRTHERSSRDSRIVGTQFPRNFEWQESTETVVLVLQVGCRFCDESASFYRELLPRAAEKNVRVVAVMPNELGEARDYLQAKEISIPTIEKLEISQLRIRGTPTILLLDKTGTVKNAWEGKLSHLQEKDVLKSLDDTVDK